MTKDIKTHDVVKDIKLLDKAEAVSHHMRDVMIHTKDSEPKDKAINNSVSPSRYAEDKITNNTANVVRKVGNVAENKSKIALTKIKEKRKTSKEIKKIQKEVKERDKTSEKNNTSNYLQKSSNNGTPELIDSSIKTKEQINRSSIKQSALSSSKSIRIRERGGSNSIEKVTKVVDEFSNHTGFRTTKQGSLETYKHSKQIERHTKQNFQYAKKLAQKSSRRIKASMKAIVNSTKRMMQSSKTMLMMLSSIGGIAIMVILVVALVGGFFLTSSSSQGNGQAISSEVIAYTPLIQKYADKYEIPHFTTVIQAVMMQESGGYGNDPMQSSECSFNKKYPNTPNGITDPEYSIEVGIQNFAQSLREAECTSPLDIAKLSLSLQGYNFGNGYIPWAVKNFGGYSEVNALIFSEQQAISHNWISYGDPQYVPHVLRYYQFSNGLLGDGNSKLVNVALSQIGNKGGAPYWSWYGYNSRVEWCACFISWCADQSGYLGTSIPKFAAVVDGIAWFKKEHQWQSRNYTPATGDIVFFDWESDGLSDHVGIVEKVENGRVYTIEGNSLNDECRQNDYTIGSSYIYGYGTPKY